MLNRPDNSIITEIKEMNIDYEVMPDLMGRSPEEVQKILLKKKIMYNIISGSENGSVIDQFPQPGVEFDISEKVIVILDKEPEPKDEEVLDYTMPDLQGLTVRNALYSAVKRNIKLSVKGAGIVISQSIPPGTKTGYGEKCNIVAN